VPQKRAEAVPSTKDIVYEEHHQKHLDTNVHHLGRDRHASRNVTDYRTKIRDVD
jgi:hypothetical protein